MTLLLLICLLFGSIVAKNIADFDTKTAEEINVISKDEFGNTALHDTARYGYFLYKAKLLIQRGADVNSRNNAGDTPLHLACKFGKTDIAEILVKNGANVNARRFNKETALHVAVKGNKADIVRILVEHGADINARDDEMKSPLFWASEYRNENIARILIENRIKDESAAALMVAVTLGNEDMVTYMIQNGFNVDVQLQDGRTPLHLAALSAKPKIVKALISNGADVNVRDKTKETPLHAVVRLARTNIVRIFAESRADLGITNERGLTPRELALWMSELPTEKYHEYLWIASILENAEERQRERAKEKRDANEQHKCLTDVFDSY